MKKNTTIRSNPQLINWEAEQNLLGALLVESNYYPKAAHLTPQDFTRDEHKAIFHTLQLLHGRGDPINLETVKYCLGENGGPEVKSEFLESLCLNFVDGRHVPFYAERIKEAADRREMLADLAKLSDAVQRGKDTKELIKRLQSYTLPDPRLNISNAVIPANDFQTLELVNRETYLHPWLSQASLNMIYGDRGIGKTQFALSLCDALTRGENFSPWEGCGQGINCLYLDGELPAQDTRQRLNALIDEGDGPCKLFIYNDAYANSLGLHRANLTNEEWRNSMKELLIQLQVKLFVIDNIASLAPGIDENSKHEWDPINQWFLELRFAEIAVIFLHHTSKEGKQRGTGAREDNIDISIQLSWPQNYEIGEGARFVVKFQKARVPQQYVHLLSETEFVLQKDELDKWVWTWGNVKELQVISYLRLCDQGFSNKDMAEALGLSTSRVSQIKKKAIDKGLLTKGGQITTLGYETIA